MNSTLVVCGDSFHSISNQYEEKTNPKKTYVGTHWSELLSNKLNWNLENLSMPSASNSVIVLQIMEAIELKPDYAFAYNNRASAKYKLKDFQGAVEDCTKAIQINSKYSYAYLNRGIAKEMLFDFSGACSDWLKASELGAEDALVYIKDCKQ